MIVKSKTPAHRMKTILRRLRLRVRRLSGALVTRPLVPLLFLGLATAGGHALAADVDLSKLPPVASRKGLSYAKDIRPLFEASCLRCHGQERPKKGLRLDSLEGVLQGSKDGKVIVPGSSEKSLLVIAVAQIDEEKAMPPKFRPGRGRPGCSSRPVGAAHCRAPTRACRPSENRDTRLIDLLRSLETR